MRIPVVSIVIALGIWACGGTGSESPSTTTGTLTTSNAVTSTSMAPTSTTDGAMTTTAELAASCDHPYLPARAGAYWEFSGDDGEGFTWEITSTADDGRSGVLETTIFFPDDTTVTIVNLTCDEEGISAPELGTFVPSDGEVSSVEEEGVFLLPPHELVSGATWTHVVTLVAELEDGTPFVWERTTTFAVVGFEEVTVAAGTFTALKVRAEREIASKRGDESSTRSGVEDLWFAESVGLVKNTEVVEPGDEPSFDFELVDYRIP